LYLCHGRGARLGKVVHWRAHLRYLEGSGKKQGKMAGIPIHTVSQCLLEDILLFEDIPFWFPSRRGEETE